MGLAGGGHVMWSRNLSCDGRWTEYGVVHWLGGLIRFRLTVFLVFLLFGCLLPDLVAKELQNAKNPVAGELVLELIGAAREGRLDQVQRLLSAGADVNGRSAEGWTALLVASVNGNLDVVEHLLKAGSEVNGQDRNGWTALTYAIEHGHKPIQAILLKYGAIASYKHAPYQGVRTVEPIRSYTEGANEKSLLQGLEGLKKMYAHMYEEAIPLLLDAVKESRTNVDAWDHLGICYRRTGRIDEAIAAYENSIEINPSNPLPYAHLGLIYVHHLKDFKRSFSYYSRVVELDPMNPEGYYGLGMVQQEMKARDDAIKSYLKAAQIYTQKGSPLVCDAFFSIGVNLAMKEPPDPGEAAKYLIKAKESGREFVPLVWAGENGLAQVVEALLEAGFDPNERDTTNGDVTALMLAASNGHLRVVQLLLAAGADVNAKHQRGSTALIQASYMGHYEVVQLLLTKGADVKIRTVGGLSALEAASSRGHTKVEHILKAPVSK
jgi:ankyrin repeat protein